MSMHSLSCQVAVDGTLLNCPAKIVLGKEDEELVFYGTLQWKGKKMSDSLNTIDERLKNDISDYVDNLLPAYVPKELTIWYQNKCMVLGVRDSNICFRLAKTEQGAALFFAFSLKQKKEAGEDASAFFQVLSSAADFFGIEQFFFYAQSGNTWLLPQLQADANMADNVPKEVRDCTFMTSAHIRMNGDSIFAKALRTLFGLKETDLFVGAGKDKLLCMIQIPAFQTNFMNSQDMYLLMKTGRQPSFLLKGSFQFSFIKEMLFTVDCGIETGSFMIEAYAHTTKSVPLWGPFEIGDTCLMIRMSAAGPAFGMYTSLFIRKWQLFGALMLQTRGSAIEPQLLSAAISDLTIPTLLENLTGTQITGIEVLDFIKILGFPFQKMSNFSTQAVRDREVSAIVRQFNTQVTDTSLQLSEEQVQLTAYEGGLNVSDLKRMRQYYIDSFGKISLMAQFYYATVNTTLGSYEITPGLFICGVIEIFGKRFEVLFSYRENDGLLAYAKIPSIDLKFIRIGPSKYSKAETQTPSIAENSVMAQFLNPVQEGMVFFLSASKTNISFYFDGHVDVLSLFGADARIIFCKGLVSIDLCVVWLDIFQVSLHLSVAYENFNSGNFKFCLVIDTSKLTEKLTAVKQNIDRAIGQLRDKIGNATRELDRARAHVNELYGQINYFDRKIADCRRAIDCARWWEKWFVAIGKGIEIGAYEVAKAGIYAAIGMANAALEVAKKVVELSGIVGESVMSAVQGVITGAMSLFYVNYIRLSAEADKSGSSFDAEIQFVALGKTYRRNCTIRKDSLVSAPSNQLSQEINAEMHDDLSNIEKGAFRSNWRRYQYDSGTTEQNCLRLKQARRHLNSSVELMTSVQNIYVDEIQTPMAQFDEMNLSLADAFDQVENILTTGARAGDVSQLSQAMGGLKRSMARKEKQGVFRDGEYAETKKLISKYEDARILYDNVVSGISDVQKKRTQLLKHHEALRQRTASMSGDYIQNGTEGSLANVLSQAEEQMYDSFPVDRSGTDFINLSREPLIHECFMEAEKELGITPSKTMQAMRSRGRKGNYNRRL